MPKARTMLRNARTICAIRPIRASTVRITGLHADRPVLALLRLGQSMLSSEVARLDQVQMAPVRKSDDAPAIAKGASLTSAWQEGAYGSVASGSEQLAG